MASVNKVILVGRLGQKPEMKHLPSGQGVCSLSVATTETWTDNGNRQEKTEWHRVSVWGKAGENCVKYLDKGRSVYIEGKLQTRSWEKDGVKQYATQIVAEKVQFLDSGRRDEQSSPPVGEPDTKENFGSLDDIPF